MHGALNIFTILQHVFTKFSRFMFTPIIISKLVNNKMILLNVKLFKSCHFRETFFVQLLSPSAFVKLYSKKIHL